MPLQEARPAPGQPPRAIQNNPGAVDALQEGCSAPFTLHSSPPQPPRLFSAFPPGSSSSCRRERSDRLEAEGEGVSGLPKGRWLWAPQARQPHPRPVPRREPPLLGRQWPGVARGELSLGPRPGGAVRPWAR